MKIAGVIRNENYAVVITFDVHLLASCECGGLYTVIFVNNMKTGEI